MSFLSCIAGSWGWICRRRRRNGLRSRSCGRFVSWFSYLKLAGRSLFYIFKYIRYPSSPSSAFILSSHANDHRDVLRESGQDNIFSILTRSYLTIYVSIFVSHRLHSCGTRTRVRAGRQSPGWVTDSPSLGLTSLLSSSSLLSGGIKAGCPHSLSNSLPISQHLPTTAWRHLRSTFLCPASRIRNRSTEHSNS